MTNDIVSELIVDDEFQSLIPPLSEEEFEGLEKDILTNGFHDWEPIVTWNGTIVDGHNRYRICQENGIEYKTIEREFASRDAAKIWIVEHQFNRRNLSKMARSELALELEPLYAAEAKRRMSDGGNSSKVGRQISDNPQRTDEQLAKLAGVSRDTIRKVKVIKTEAEKGNQTAIDARNAVQRGEKSINAAYLDVRPKADESDMRPICTICGEPIDDGDSYGHNRFKHKSCAMRDTESTRGKRGGRPGAWNKYADDDLISNVAVYSIDSLMVELTGSVSIMSEAISESILINESMGVVLTDEQKQRIQSAISALSEAIEKIKDESNV